MSIEEITNHEDQKLKINVGMNALKQAEHILKSTEFFKINHLSLKHARKVTFDYRSITRGGRGSMEIGGGPSLSLFAEKR